MIDITHKIDTLREATAKAVISVSGKSIAAIKNKCVPKGDVFTSAKIAGLLAIKNTSSVLPHCHPIPVEYADFEFNIRKNNLIEIVAGVKTIYKTGCEMEALHGVSVAALTIYDMLKPIDKNIEIGNIVLLKKSGGKSDLRSYYDSDIDAAVLIISDSVFAKKNKDQSGKFIKEKLGTFGIDVKNPEIIPDEADAVQKSINQLVKKKMDLIITTGGTGFSKRDITSGAVRSLLDEEITGVMEFARAYGQERMPYAMLSGGVAGFKVNTLILTFPGSLNAVREYMNSLFPYVLHLFKVRKGFKH
ncbi:MAG: bifunctional molybdenum cofactor biosynthesis protein MoaC/MoaB [Ignavibacteria bacterium]